MQLGAAWHHVHVNANSKVPRFLFPDEFNQKGKPDLYCSWWICEQNSQLGGGKKEEEEKEEEEEEEIGARTAGYLGATQTISLSVPCESWIRSNPNGKPKADI